MENKAEHVELSPSAFEPLEHSPISEEKTNNITITNSNHNKNATNNVINNDNDHHNTTSIIKSAERVRSSNNNNNNNNSNIVGMHNDANTNNSFNSLFSSSSLFGHSNSLIDSSFASSGETDEYGSELEMSMGNGELSHLPLQVELERQHQSKISRFCHYCCCCSCWEWCFCFGTNNGNSRYSRRQLKETLRNFVCSFSTSIALMLLIMICCAYAIIWSSTKYMSESAIHAVWELYHETTVSLSNERSNMFATRYFAVIFDIAIGLWDKDAYFGEDTMMFLCSFLRREFSESGVHSLELASIDHGKTVFCAQEFDNNKSRWFHYGGYSVNGTFNASYIVNISSLRFAEPLTTWFEVEPQRRNVSAWLTQMYHNDVYMNSFRSAGRTMTTIMENNIPGWRSDINEVYTVAYFFPLRVRIRNNITNTSELDTSVYLKLWINPQFYLRQRGDASSNTFKVVVLTYSTLHWPDPLVFADNWHERTVSIQNSIASDFQSHANTYLPLSKISAPLMREAVKHVNVPSLSIDNYRHTSKFKYKREASLVTGQLYFTDNDQAVASMMASTEKQIAPNQQTTLMIIILCVVAWIVLSTVGLWVFVFVFLVKPLRTITKAVEQSTRRLCASRPFVEHHHWFFGLNEVYKLINAYNASMQQLKMIETFLPARVLGRLRDLHMQQWKVSQSKQNEEICQTRHYLHRNEKLKEQSETINKQSQQEITLRQAEEEEEEHEEQEQEQQYQQEEPEIEQVKPHVSVHQAHVQQKTSSLTLSATHRPENDQNIRLVHTVVYVIPTTVLKSKNAITPIMETDSSSESWSVGSDSEELESGNQENQQWKEHLSGNGYDEEYAEPEQSERRYHNKKQQRSHRAAQSSKTGKRVSSLPRSLLEGTFSHRQSSHPLHHHDNNNNNEKDSNNNNNSNSNSSSNKSNLSSHPFTNPRPFKASAGTVYRSSEALEMYLSVIMHTAHNCGGLLHAIHPMYAVVHFNAAVRELFEREADRLYVKTNHVNNNNNTATTNNNNTTIDNNVFAAPFSGVSHVHRYKTALQANEERKSRYLEMESRAKEIDAEAAVKFAFALQRELIHRHATLPHATIFLDTSTFLSGQYYSASLDQIVLPLTGRNIWHDIGYVLPLIGVSMAMSEETALLVRQSVRQVPIEVLYVTRRAMLDQIDNSNINNNYVRLDNVKHKTYTSDFNNDDDNNNNNEDEFSQYSSIESNEERNDANDDDDDEKENSGEIVNINNINHSYEMHKKEKRVMANKRLAWERERGSAELFHKPNRRRNGVFDIVDYNESRTYKLILYDVIHGPVKSPTWISLVHSYFEIFSFMLFARYNKAKNEIEEVRRELQNMLLQRNLSSHDINEYEINYAIKRLELMEYICRTHVLQRDHSRFIRYPVGLMDDASTNAILSVSPSVSPTFIHPIFERQVKDGMAQEEPNKNGNSTTNNNDNANINSSVDNMEQVKETNNDKYYHVDVNDRKSVNEAAAINDPALTRETYHVPITRISSELPSTLPEEEEESSSSDVLIMPKLTKQSNRVLREHRKSNDTNTNVEMERKIKEDALAENVECNTINNGKQSLTEAANSLKETNTAKSKIAIDNPNSNNNSKWSIIDTNGSIWFVSWHTSSSSNVYTMLNANNVLHSNSSGNNTDAKKFGDEHDNDSITGHSIQPLRTHLCLSNTGTLATVRFWFIKSSAINRLNYRQASQEWNNLVRSNTASNKSENISFLVPSKQVYPTQQESKNSIDSVNGNTNDQRHVLQEVEQNSDNSYGNNASIIIPNDFSKRFNNNYNNNNNSNNNNNNSNSNNSTNSSTSFHRQQMISIASLFSKTMGGTSVVNLIGLTLQYSDCVGIISEFCVGGDLRTALTRCGRALPISVILRYSYSILNNLLYIHENGLIHGHLSPEEVMLCTDGSCKLRGVFANLRLAQEWLNLPFTPYASPELLFHKTCTTANDMYSFGLILIEMMTGHMPWKWSSSVVSTKSTEELIRILTSYNETEFVNALRLEQIEFNYDNIDLHQGVLCDILSQCLRADPLRRINASDALDMLSIELNK